ncbi:MAG: hypothetical protein M1457_11110, partial [bacterium]|nr:hypothetical protein [bacterium]
AHDPLMIPTAADAYPTWTIEHFRAVIAQARPGQAIILQFHGVPDPVHPWVHTPPELFRQCMNELKKGGFHVLALRDLEPYIDRAAPPDDPMARARYPEP